MPVPKPQEKRKGKRNRGSNDEADEDSEEHQDGRDEEGDGVVGGSEPRRRVSRLKIGPAPARKRKIWNVVDDVRRHVQRAHFSMDQCQLYSKSVLSIATFF